MPHSPPSDAELIVLKHFWKAGPQSVREVHAAIGDAMAWKPSTTRTVIARMEAKGLVTREDMHGLSVYSAATDKVSTLAGLMTNLARDVFEIKGAVPASFFADSPLLSEDEAAELESLVSAALEENGDD
ncbi:MAG: BlaI/MecI/CopY family transcriptional regulator [Hyphomonadaceae bacterium]|nr:BlaI/MecI/CopY family transcriptional regulator [Hyphomonadaceae bacterium]